MNPSNLHNLVLPDIISVCELHRHLGLSKSVIRSKFRTGEIPGRKIGRRWFVARRALVELLSTPQSTNERSSMRVLPGQTKGGDR